MIKSRDKSGRITWGRVTKCKVNNIGRECSACHVFKTWTPKDLKGLEYPKN